MRDEAEKLAEVLDQFEMDPLYSGNKYPQNDREQGIGAIRDALLVARQETREEDCKLICGGCYLGWSRIVTEGIYAHKQPGGMEPHRCVAAPIRARAALEEK